jgi:tetratricopeptide (TPR) repeat protein
MEVPVGLARESSGYRLDVNRSLVDYYQFQKLIGETRELRRRGQLRDALLSGSRALDLWRGRPLDELRTDRANNWRRQVRTDEWLPANAAVVEIMLELGDVGGALNRLNELRTEHADDLSLAKLRLTALRRLTRHDDASAYYFDVRKRLRENGDEQAVEHLGRFYDALVRTDQREWTASIRAGASIVPRQLPHDVADFVGRDELLRALDAATTTEAGTPSPGVIVLDGMGGVGKTALAVRWCHRSRNNFPDGTLYVDLNGFSHDPALDSDIVVDLFLAGLGQSSDPAAGDIADRDVAGSSAANARMRALRLRTLLSGRRMLVLLDNAQDSAQVENLVPLLADAVVLVTSRQELTRLHAWKGARRLRVGPMSPHESSALLARRLRGDGRATGPGLVDLASLGGGLPLAINLVAEYAAARPDTPLTELAEQLRRDRSLLTIGEHGDTGASLRTLFAYSYHGLPAVERRLFALLGWHPGPELSDVAAAAINGRPVADTRHSLDALVSAHLLDEPARGRFRYHSLVRDYARHMAAQDVDERASACARLLSFYLKSARNAERQVFPSHSGPPPLPLEEGVEPVEFADSPAAMSWVLTERLTLDAAIRLAVAEHGYEAYAWRLPHAVSAIYERHGLYQQSKVALEIAVTAAQRAGDIDAESASWQQLGLVQLTLGDFTSARQCLHHALRLAEESGNEGVYALHSLARLEVEVGNAAAGIDFYRQCLEKARRTGNLEVQCWTHYRLGEVLREQGQYDNSLPELFRAQWLAGTIQELSAEACILTALAATFAGLREFTTAEVYCRQAAKLIISIGYVSAGGRLSAVLAELYRAQGDLRHACHYARQCAAIYRRVSQAKYAEALDALADLHMRLGNMDAAAEGWEQALGIFKNLDRGDRVNSVRVKLVELLTGNPGQR